MSGETCQVLVALLDTLQPGQAVVIRRWGTRWLPNGNLYTMVVIDE